MRITAFHVNGFGVLTDTGLDGLAPGLNVILGDNGAGKSTLLEFFRAVLFGFRDKRREGVPRYEPVRGGAHGGSLTVAMADGSQYKIIRAPGSHVVGEETVIALSDGAPPRTLADLLGGASRDVFENVFAFSLAELQAVTTLDNEEVKARLYAAAAGTGAQAVPQVRATLDKQAKDLYSARARCELVRILEAMDALTKRQRDISHLTEEYARLREELALVLEEIAHLREKEKDAEAELVERTTLLAAWPDWQALLGYEVALAGLGEVAPMPERAEERLEGALRTQQERERLVAQTETSVRAAEEEIAAACARLGDGWTRERAARFDAGEVTASTVAEFAREMSAASELVARGEETVRMAEQAAAQAADARTALEAEERSRWPEPPRALSSIEEDLEAVRTARTEASQLVEERGVRDALEGRRHAAEGDVRNLRQAPEPIAPTARIPLIVAIGALACASVVYQISLPAAVGLFVVFLVAAAIATRDHRRARSLVRAQRAQEIREAEGKLKDLEDQIAAADESIGRRQAALNEAGARFGLSVINSPSDLEPVERRLLAERDSATEYAAFSTRLHDARKAEAEALDRCEAARRELDTLTRSLEAIQQRWAGWLSELGLPAGLKPSEAAELVQRIRQAQALIAAQEQRMARLQQARRELEEARAAVRDIIIEAGDTDLDSFRRHAEHWHKLQELRAKIREAEAGLIARAGSPDNWIAMRHTLESSSREELDAQAARAREELSAIRGARDAATRRQGETEKSLQQMETSEEQEAIAMRLAELRAQAQEILQRWAVLNVCMNLLDEARQRFELEHQPAVVRRASEYLCSITGGRYVCLIRQLDRDVLLAETDAGELKERPAWNRGLLEQIYLSLRLGFIEDYSGNAEPLPVIMDDVFANFDPNHARRAAETLTAFAREHQVLYLTCHPETVQFLRNADRTVACYQLDRYRLEPLRASLEAGATS